MRPLGRALVAALGALIVTFGAPTVGAAGALAPAASSSASGSASGSEQPCQSDGQQVPATGAVFNDPLGSTQDQYRIIDLVNQNIAGASPGSIVRIATLDLKLTTTTDLLIRAAQCGVHVRVILPGRAWEGSQALRLREALGTDVTAGSYVSSCVNSCLTDGTKGVMHIKSYLFSETGGTSDVVIYSSSNLVDNQAVKKFNDAYQLVGNPDVYRAARRHFDKLRWDAPSRFRPVQDVGGYRLFFLPRPGGNFHTELLDATSCGGPRTATRIEFTASIWSRAGVARRLSALHDDGCDVRVVFARDKVTKRVMSILAERGVPTRVQSAAAGEAANHSKFVAIAGRHLGGYTRVVYSGALNVSTLSEHHSDNNMIRIEDAAAYRAYHQHFSKMWNASRPLVGADLRAAGRVRVSHSEARD